MGSHNARSQVGAVKRRPEHGSTNQTIHNRACGLGGIPIESSGLTIRKVDTTVTNKKGRLTTGGLRV
jgi:hypothetical protein